MCFRRLDTILADVLGRLEIEGGGSLGEGESAHTAPGPGREGVPRHLGLGMESAGAAKAPASFGVSSNALPAQEVNAVRENITVPALRPLREPVPGSAVVFSLIVIEGGVH